ncbi:MAG TPA: UDP-glucose/GDP-mannose dehydrogenase family protein [Bryobacteraceae bacterium]|nr:UDP-glucose/GDP-mannose dehydrogenase family protein [Bryobacteraceae bacterium]
MNVSIVGAGYVGITTGVALAYLGHKVTLLDSDEARIRLLSEGKFPIYEPYLEEIADLAKARMHYTTDAAEAHPDADVIFIAVGTPSQADGNPNLSYLQAAATAIGKHLGDGFTVVVNKSTVPIGCGNWVESLVSEAFEARNGQRPKGKFSVASNPEFLREGSALHDSLYPDRVVVGSDDPRALDCLYALYKPVVEQTFPAPTVLARPEALGAVPLITTNLASAELIKYAANAFLALKISFMNEISQLAEKVGADITQIGKGIGLDARIGTRFLQAGLGWGGSCFGKDTSALIATAHEYGLTMPIVQAAREVNYRQRDRVLEKLLGELKILKGRTIGLLGLAFKPHTDDLRDAPALDIARKLIERGAKVRAHDPIALDRARREFGDTSICFADTTDMLTLDSDALILVTEWPQYRELPWEKLAAGMRTPLLVDGRNFLDREALEGAGFRYIGMGR